VYNSGVGNVPVQQLNPANPSDVNFRPFRGAGRRVGD
jgi:hypothetical protein